MAFNTNDLIVGKSLAEYAEYLEPACELFRAVVQPDNVVIDVGASIGVFSVLLGKLVGPGGHVLAFEPARLPFYNLGGNIVTNELVNVLAMQRAVGDKEAQVRVPELDPSIPQNFHAIDLRSEHQQGHFVKQVTIDSFQLQKLDFLKVSTNGMEVEVLKGAEQTIKKCRPLLYIHCGDTSRATALVRSLNYKGYKQYLHTPQLFNKDNHAGNRQNVFGNSPQPWLLCVPKEKTAVIDKERFSLTAIGRDNVKIDLEGSTPHEAMNVINRTEDSIVQGYITMANAFADRLYDCHLAMHYLDKAIQIQPDDWRLYAKALPILSKFLRYDEALTYAEKSLDTGGPIDAVYNKAVILGCLNRHEEAIECYDQVLEFRPDCPLTHFNRACDLLKLERYNEGWEEYEWRFKRGNTALLQMIGFLPDLPRWEGEPLEGKRILLYIEQGAGDQIQMLRYVHQIKALGGHTIVACYPSLKRIVDQIKGVDEVVVHGEDIALPDGFQADVMQSLMSLPRILKVGTEQPITGKPYIKLRGRKPNNDKLRIGICYAGSETHANDFCRSTQLKHFQPIANLPNTELVNLQVSTNQRTWQQCGFLDLREGADIQLTEPKPKIVDYYDTAQNLKQLDLVITVDTSVAHLAGAMGIPTFIAIGPNSDWRWGTGTTSAWYDSVRLFRGTGWQDIFEKITAAVTQMQRR